jgi:two-component system NtrC family sensor kinase
MKNNEGLDILTLTDKNSKVILRTSNPKNIGDDQRQNELVTAVLKTGKPVTGNTVISNLELRIDSPELAERAIIHLTDTPRAKPMPGTEETSGMMLMAAAPVFDSQSNVIGALFGGVLINQNYEIVDRIKQTVFQDIKYKDKDISTATIFLGDVRVSTVY